MAPSPEDLEHAQDRARRLADGLPPPTAEQRSKIEAAIQLYRDDVAPGDAA